MSRTVKHFRRSVPSRLASWIVLLVFVAAAAAVWAFPPKTAESAAERVPDAENVFFVDDASGPLDEQDFSKFQHSSSQHARMPCLLCHKRQVGLVTPKMPGHMPCAGCHVQQFADNQNVMCSICHTTTSVKPFPPLRSFGVQFNHAIHVRQTGCATCHRSNRGGAGFSIPSDGNAHASCFQCHGPTTEIGGRNIGSCGTCHIPGRLTSVSDQAKAYSINFSHREHLRGRMDCSSCHTVLAGSARGRQVTQPAPQMHFPAAGRTSCATCHNNKRAFGPPDFNDCKRCHEANSFKFR
jgi:c(7)-type cytochrome triheme protein